jgi:lysozyme family protein
MIAPKLTAALAKEYSDLFNRCEIAPDKMAEVDEAVQRILRYQNRYASIAAQSNVPWYVIAVIHNMDQAR